MSVQREQRSTQRDQEQGSCMLTPLLHSVLFCAPARKRWPWPRRLFITSWPATDVTRQMHRVEVSHRQPTFTPLSPPEEPAPLLELLRVLLLLPPPLRCKSTPLVPLL